MNVPRKRRKNFESLGMRYQERRFGCIIPGKEDMEDLVVFLSGWFEDDKRMIHPHSQLV